MSLPQHDLSAVQAQNIIAGQVTNSSKRRKGSSAHETPIRALLPRQILYPTTVALQHAIFPTGPDAIRGQAVINGNDDAYYPGQNTGLQLSQIAFPCPKNLCEQSFDTRAELEEHETAHDWEKTHEFPCPISERYPDLCNSEGFQKAVDADRHVAQHFPPQFHCRHGCDNLSYRTDQRVRHEKEFCKLRPQEGAMIPSSAASIAEYSPAAPPTLSQRSRGRVVEPSQAMQRSISELATVHPVYQFPVTPTPLVRRGRKSTPGRPGSTRAPRSAAHSSLARSEPPTVFSTPARQPLSTPLTSYKPIMPAPRTNQGFYSDDPNDPNYFSSPSLPK
ncbi:hypothetical protein B0A48_12024 [Cryoendolithus antarcticus]|uniref:C2H2-type domain-containing protein n=1 Tax=Cryoendolithus antarcticus TaxID=1507870 RepID=A0A1V8STH2_9PEZI|nr:hypothetical protein B0A48_12024 [Cryoendolithus antarcticus]